MGKTVNMTMAEAIVKYLFRYIWAWQCNMPSWSTRKS